LADIAIYTLFYWWYYYYWWLLIIDSYFDIIADITHYFIIDIDADILDSFRYYAAQILITHDIIVFHIDLLQDDYQSLGHHWSLQYHHLLSHDDIIASSSSSSTISHFIAHTPRRLPRYRLPPFHWYHTSLSIIDYFITDYFIPFDTYTWYRYTYTYIFYYWADTLLKIAYYWYLLYLWMILLILLTLAIIDNISATLISFLSLIKMAAISLIHDIIRYRYIDWYWWHYLILADIFHNIDIITNIANIADRDYFSFSPIQYWYFRLYLFSLRLLLIDSWLDIDIIIDAAIDTLLLSLTDGHYFAYWYCILLYWYWH